MSGAEPWRTYREYLAGRFPGYARIHKVPLTLGTTCPNRDGSKGVGGCTFCDNQSFSLAATRLASDWNSQLEQALKRMSARHAQAGLLAYFQPHTNTHVLPELLWEACQAVLGHPRVVGISIGTRPDCLGDSIRQVLQQVAVQCPLILEVGLQTSHNQTLARINRGHTREEFAQAMQDCANLGADLSTHLILGLPGENMQMWRETAMFLAQFPLVAVKLHPLHLVQGTPLAREWLQGADWQLPSLEEYCQGVVQIIQLLPKQVAIERFSGEVLGDGLVAPAWSGQRDLIVARVREILTQSKT